MRNISNLMKQSTAIVMYIVSLDAYRRAVSNDNTTKNTDLLIKDTVDNYNKAIKQIEEQDLKLFKQLANTGNEELIKDSTETANKSLSALMTEINKLGHKFELTNNNNYSNPLEDILNSYSTIELGAIGHISASIVLFFCLSNIAIAYYSDKIIIYFKLEEKYPKLTK
jgi:hypothetical protein